MSRKQLLVALAASVLMLVLVIIDVAQGHLGTKGMGDWVQEHCWGYVALFMFAFLDNISTAVALSQTPMEGEGNPFMWALMKKGRWRFHLVRWGVILLVSGYIALGQQLGSLAFVIAMFGLVVMSNMGAIILHAVRPELSKKLRALSKEMDVAAYLIRFGPLMVSAGIMAHLYMRCEG